MQQNLDEIWSEYAAKEAEWYRNRFEIYKKCTRQLHQSKIGKVHHKLLRLVGPEWYQELSPTQLEIVDRFQFCILKDLHEHTWSNSRQNLLDLGLKCSQESVYFALTRCNGCPEEFLLIVYQTIDPKRKSYSLNDRLLLSAVVHLTMRNTLKELHVRIPSPPRNPAKTVRIARKKPKRIQPKSPYLQVNTFKPAPRKHGIYANRHIQFPESPYFDYLSNFRTEYPAVISSQLNKEIEDELEEAQRFYEGLVDFRPVPILSKPRVYYKTIDEPSENDLVPVQAEEEEGEEEEEEAEEEVEEEDEEENEEVQEELEEEIEEEQEKKPSCDCLAKYLAKVKDYKNHIKRQELIEKLKTNKMKYIIGGIIETPNGPECLITGCMPRRVPPGCNCMYLYNKYLKEHSQCMKIYEQYFEDMQVSLDEYTEEMSKENQDSESQEESSHNVCRCCGAALSRQSKESSIEEEEVEEEEIIPVEKLPSFRRFFIYNKLPCHPKKQRDIVKAALESMADDGFPLAKLPDSYKLPHFKLWMQKRCGKFWTQDDRRRYLLKNIQFWNHTDSCQRDIRPVKLKIGQQEAQAITWARADYCRKIVREAKNEYCKHLKEAVIDMGREFFPTTFQYEFPSKIFRDCYFTYIPTKQADVFGKFVWQVTEVKDFSRRKICK